MSQLSSRDYIEKIPSSFSTALEKVRYTSGLRTLLVCAHHNANLSRSSSWQIWHDASFYPSEREEIMKRDKKRRGTTREGVKKEAERRRKRRVEQTSGKIEWRSLRYVIKISGMYVTSSISVLVCPVDCSSFSFFYSCFSNFLSL